MGVTRNVSTNLRALLFLEVLVMLLIVVQKRESFFENDSNNLSVLHLLPLLLPE